MSLRSLKSIQNKFHFHPIVESAGAEIIDQMTTTGLPSNNAMVKLWNFPLFYHTMSPRMAIQPNVHPGNCFAFFGDKGHLSIKLARRILVQNVTIEHISKVSAILAV